MEVTAVDVDPVVRRDFERAMLATPTPSGAMRFVLSSRDNRVPEPDANFDCIYSVSVLEHVPNKISALRELKRLLRPGGYLIATFDVCLRGGNDLDPRQFVEFMTFVRQEFELVWPEREIHPSSTLTCYNGPYPYRLRTYLKSPLAKLGFAGRTLWRRACGLPGPPVDYAFMGVVLRKVS
jgi:SAM-dependent methyltransferase